LVSLSSDLPGLSGDASNLVVRAAQTLAGAPRGGEAARELKPVRATLEKLIPLGAGLGGGSSDAARTLIALNRLWGMNWPTEKLAPLAEALGSDVPFFLFGASSICTGRGEVVRPVTQPRFARWCVLILPEIHMPTAAVYWRFDELGLGFDDEIAREPDWANWSRKKSKDFLAGLVNDLEGPAFEIRADLGKLRADVELRLGRTVRMSGSGSSLFTLFDEQSDATEAAESVEKNFGVRAIAVQLAPELRDDVGST
jgi:4-diphosphocytidyl-2-C-methyl-D-erythritol kinase